MKTTLRAGSALFAGLAWLAAAACSAGGQGPSSSSEGNGGSGAGAPSTTTGSGGGLIELDGGNAGGGSSVGGGCAAVSQTATNQIAPVDIIWAIDTSDSMVGELQATQDNMNMFASTILSSGIDVHVVLIAKAGHPDDGNIFNPDPGICIGPPLGLASCPGDSNPPAFLHVNNGVGSNNALNKFIDNYQQYKGALRQNAVKYFAVVTDDEASDGPNNSAAAFINSVDNLDPGYFDTWKFFGVYCTGNCGVFLACADTGDVYNDLVAQKGGIAGDLCGGNSNGFASVFAALAQTVVQGAQLDCKWDIPEPPVGQVFDKNLVNVNYTPSNGAPGAIYHVTTLADCGPQGGWYYDDDANPTAILVCPTTCAAIQSDSGGKIDILFGCTTENVPK